MPTPEQFHELTAKLKILVEKDKEQRILAEASLVNSQLDALAKIKALYPHEVDKNYNRYVAPFLDRYAFLKRPSCLAIIKKHAYEPAHTLYLAHLFESNKAILSALIKSAECLSGKDELLQHIQASETYQVKAEEQIKDCGKITGRIPDLTITDERNRWVLIIENKIESRFSDGRIGKNQIDDYRIYAERTFPAYDRYYLTVSYSDCNRKDALDNQWGYCDYCSVFNAIIQCEPLDRIAEDYLSALMQLLCNGSHKRIQKPDTEQIPRQLVSIYQFYTNVITQLKISPYEQIDTINQ